MATRCSRSSAAHTARLYPYSYSPGTRIARRYWPKPPQTRGLPTATPGSIPGSPAQQEPHRMGLFPFPEPFSDRPAAAPTFPHRSAGIRLGSPVSIPRTIPRESPHGASPAARRRGAEARGASAPAGSAPAASLAEPLRLASLLRRGLDQSAFVRAVPGWIVAACLRTDSAAGHR
jgi:hypothetical protein